jgi:hypothetical protein
MDTSEDRYEMLHPNEKKKADAWMAKHKESCAEAKFITTTSVSGYGYRVKTRCLTCGAREDVSDEAKRDPYPHR